MLEQLWQLVKDARVHPAGPAMVANAPDQCLGTFAGAGRAEKRQDRTFRPVGEPRICGTSRRHQTWIRTSNEREDQVVDSVVPIESWRWERQRHSLVE